MTDFTVTPYSVDGAVDYDRLRERFGADALTADQIDRFPEPVHRLLRWKVFYAGRDVDEYLAAIESGERVSIVTGVGPSGPLHVGHVFPFYFARYLQETVGAHVFIPFSDDEKYYSKDLTFDAIYDHLRDNLLDVLAVGFDPDLTTVVVDTMDADVVYPHAAEFAGRITQSTVDAVYGEPPNVGLSFYPAVQATHLLLPQLVYGPHRTLVPVAVDQDPHVRVCRDVAGKARYDLHKPGALLSRFLPRLGGGGGKMSSSEDAPAIYLTDDRDTVARKVHEHAHSGGRQSVEAHREHGGDPEVDVAYQLLAHFFCRDDDRLAELAADYRSGALLSGELKTEAADAISSFLAAHQDSRAALGSVEDELGRFRLDDEERELLRPTPV